MNKILSINLLISIYFFVFSELFSDLFCYFLNFNNKKTVPSPNFVFSFHFKAPIWLRSVKTCWLSIDDINWDNMTLFNRVSCLNSFRNAIFSLPKVVFFFLNKIYFQANVDLFVFYLQKYKEYKDWFYKKTKQMLTLQWNLFLYINN